MTTLPPFAELESHLLNIDESRGLTPIPKPPQLQPTRQRCPWSPIPPFSTAPQPNYPTCFHTKTTTSFQFHPSTLFQSQQQQSKPKPTTATTAKPFAPVPTSYKSFATTIQQLESTSSTTTLPAAIQPASTKQSTTFPTDIEPQSTSISNGSINNHRATFQCRYNRLQ
ncbi:hypothetical protein MHU86_13196 [Fragilaria crotonensis]|nr:hypothetical protein MHU86_13196 [Fragilaria crotonensis]